MVTVAAAAAAASGCRYNGDCGCSWQLSGCREWCRSNVVIVVVLVVGEYSMIEQHIRVATV